uniref:Smoothelin domain-containing protein n=1 Tax=Anopheles minimus TaxID=112268 RepID=A0A182VSP9_9DIPT
MLDGENEWQQAEDFSRKKEIRAYMYKLREQRLKDFYASNDSSPPYFLMDNASATFGMKKSTVAGSHGDSLVDQSFESFKTKEIRDSESPTRFGNMAIPSDNSGWQIRTTEEVSGDGKTHTVRTSATTQGIKEMDGGRSAFAGKNLESHSEHYDGDDSNFVHSKGDQSTTVLVEDSITEDENGRSVSGSTHSTTTSVSSTRVVYQQQNGDSERPKKQLTDATDQAALLEFGDDHFSSSQMRTVTSSSSCSVLRNSATTKNSDQSTTNITDNQREEQMIPKELSKDPERVREAFRLAQGSGKIIEREETMVNASTKMIAETKRLDDGTTVTTRTYENITNDPSYTSTKMEQSNPSSAKKQPENVGRSSNATSEFIRQEKANQSSTSMTKTSSQRIMVEVDAAHDSFARSLRSVSPTGSVRSVRSNVTQSGRSSASPEKAQPLRSELISKPDYMRSTFTSERKVSGFQEQQSGPTERSPSPRKVSETLLHTGSRSTSPSKQSATASSVRELEKTTESQIRVTEFERQNYPEVDGIKTRGSTKPPLVRSETYEERCRKILGMPNRPVDDETKGESKSIFSTYDNTVTVQQSRSELREQRKKIEQEIKLLETNTTNSPSRQTTDEQDSIIEKEHYSSRKTSSVSKDSSPIRKLSAQQISPTRKPSSTPKENSPTRKVSAENNSISKSSPVKDYSPTRKTLAREISPVGNEATPLRKQSTQEEDLLARKSPVKDASPTRKSPAKDVSPKRSPSITKDASPSRKPSQTEISTIRTSPSKEPSSSRKPACDDLQLKNERVPSPVKLSSETTTKGKATILVEQKKVDRNISVAEITILPVMEVSENVRTKTTTTLIRTHEKVLTKQSSDSKFDRRPTTTTNSRVITNKSSSDFDIKRRAAEMATQSKTRSSATSPDKRRPTVGTDKSVPVKQNHITVAKIRIESMRKPSTQTKFMHGVSEEMSSVRSNTKRTSEQVIAPKRPVEPETDPESSKDTGISDNSEVEETVESVIEMNVTGTSCCRHTDRKDSAPVYRTTGVARAGKNYSRSSSENHLRATNTSSNRQTSANLNTAASKTTTTDRLSSGGRKTERPVKHVATKTINLSTKAVSGVSALSTTCSSTLGSDHLDNVVIDIQLAKSSREPTPNKLIPIPVSPDTEDTGKPRYPDAVQEPDDDATGTRQNRTQRVNNIPIFEEATNEYVGCEITEMDEATSQQATRITNLDRVTEDDESLLSVTEKVNKFAQEARRLQEPASTVNADGRPQPARFSVRPEYDDIDEHLKSDECLLSVSDKVTKFISTAEEVKKIRTSGPFVPENEDVPVKLTEGDECLLSVNEKVNRFANRIRRTSENREHESMSSSVGRSGRCLQASIGKDQAEQQESEEENENDETKQHPSRGSESVSGKFVPQKSPELVKNAMRSTARHIVEDAAAEDLVQSSGSSIANRYRTTTMSKQYEKQTPAALTPCVSPITLRSTEAVKKAKEIFEKGQTVQDARQRDILNRASIWEDRRNKLQQQTDQKSTDLKLADIGVTERKTTQTAREESKTVDELAHRKESITKVERMVEPEATKTIPSQGRRDSGSGVRPPAYIRDTVSAKKNMFEKRISSSKLQVEYTTQTSQEGTETLTSTLPRRPSLKQRVESNSPSSISRPAHTGDQSKPSYMNHTVASLEHINANQRRDSLDHGVATVHHEAPTARNVTNSAKFGVELKRLDTSNRPATAQTTATSKRKASAGDGQTVIFSTSSPVIEEIFDLEMLERMLESVTGYEQRRRIRAQIRIVKKQKEMQGSTITQTEKQTNATSVKTTTPTQNSSLTNTREASSAKRKDSSPTRSSALYGRKHSSSISSDAIDAGQDGIESDKIAERNSKQRQQQGQESVNAKTNVTTTTKTTTFAGKSGAVDRHPTTNDDRPIWATSNILKKASENTRTYKSSSMTSSSTTTGGAVGGRKVVSSTSSYQQVESSTDPKTTTDCITSSYGVGPTDENGLPLFGIRALKKKATPAPTTTEDTKISGTIVTETLYAENGGPTVGKRSTMHYTNEPGTFSELVRNTNRDDTGHDDDGVAANQRANDKMMAIRKTETIDAAGTNTEELEVMDSLEMAARREAKVVRKGSVKELTERFIHRESSGSLMQESTRTYPKAGLILRSSAQSQSSRASTPATDGCSMQSGSVDEFEQDQMETGVTMRQVRSFLNDTSKVVDVRDVLQRMSNADNVTEQGDTAEDQEARALLNKFLGASVLMSGVESMVSSTGSMLSETASLPASNAVATKKVSLVRRQY